MWLVQMVLVVIVMWLLALGVTMLEANRRAR